MKDKMTKLYIDGQHRDCIAYVKREKTFLYFYSKKVGVYDDLSEF